MAIVVISLALIAAYILARRQRTAERLAAMQQGYDLDLYFSSKLLGYIPWQFWMSAFILVVLIVAVFVSRQMDMADATESFVDLVKYVTGILFGSMFGKNAEPNLARQLRPADDAKSELANTQQGRSG